MEKNIFPYKSEVEIQKNIEEIQNIYAHIVDEKSREIYVYRLLLTFTEDVRYLRKLILSIDAGKEFEKFLYRQNKIYVYGAGIRGRRLVQMFPEMKWESYIDIKAQGVCNGLPVIKPEEIQLGEEDIILITNYNGYKEIKSDLISLGIEKSQIICMTEFEINAHENQYFEERCIKNFTRTSGDFIDAGCFDGRDCVRFLESTLNNNVSVYGFEPDKINYQKCKRTLGSYKNANVYNLGLSDSKKEELFLSNKGEEARVTSSGNCMIKMDTLDNFFNGKHIGFIKMDIEGSEKSALLGARQHIEKDKPNMIISVYHKAEDVIVIPKLLLDINPEYTFAFGHYSSGSACDTVMYAFEQN